MTRTGFRVLLTEEFDPWFWDSALGDPLRNAALGKPGFVDDYGPAAYFLDKIFYIHATV